MKISERIFEIMEEKGMRQLDLSKKTGIAQAVLSDWKTKKTNPSSKYIMKICEALECTPYDILVDKKGNYYE